MVQLIELNAFNPGELDWNCSWEGQRRPVPETVRIEGVVRRASSNEFSTVTVNLNGESFLLTSEALRQLASLARVPMDYLATLPDELLRANLDHALRRVARLWKIEAVIDDLHQIRIWLRTDKSPIRPRELLEACAARFPREWEVRLLGRPTRVDAGRVCYRFSSLRLEHCFESSPVRGDRHHFAVQLVLDHSGWVPAELEVYGYRLVCANGMVMPFRKLQARLFLVNLDRLVQRLCEELPRGFALIRETLIPRLEGTIRTEVRDVHSRLARLTRSAPENVRRLVMAAFERLENLGQTEYRLINALTAAASSAECPADWARSLSRFAGELAAGQRCPTCMRRV